MPISFSEDAAQNDQPTLTPGVHVCTIKSLEPHVSKAGKNSLHLTCRVDDGEWMHEYMPPVRSSIARICTAVGIPTPTGNEIDEESLRGLTFRARLKVEPGRDGYQDKYRVQDWLKPKAAEPAAPAAPKPTATKTINQERVAAALAGKASRQPVPAAASTTDDVDGIPF